LRVESVRKRARVSAEPVQTSMDPVTAFRSASGLKTVRRVRSVPALRQVCGDRVDIIQIHRQRVVDFLADRNAGVGEVGVMIASQSAKAF